MANTLTGYGAVLDTPATDLAINMRVEEMVVAETGGTAAAVVSLKDSGGTNTIATVTVGANSTVSVDLGGLSLGTVQFTKTGTGTAVVSLIKRSRM